MTVESGQVGETGEVEQTEELSLREELAKNLADLKGEQTEEVVAPAEKVTTTTEPLNPAETAETPAETAPAEPKAKAPQSWSAAERAHWEKIPPEVQAVIARREEEAHRGITTLGQD